MQPGRIRAVGIYYSLLTLVSIHFALAYTCDLPIYQSFHKYAAGELTGPTQSRILMSLVFRWTLWLSDHYGKRFQVHSINHGPVALFSDPLNVAMLLIAAGALFIATEAVRIGARSLGLPDGLSRWGAFLVPLMAYFDYILVAEVRTQVPYDLPQLAFFAVCITLLLKRRWLIFLLVFLVATLNRESTCFLIPFAALLTWNEPPFTRRRNWAIAAAMLSLSLIWCVLRYYTLHFYSAETSLVEYHWRYNIHALANPFHWPTVLSVFAFLWLPYALGFRSIGHRGLKACALLIPFWIIIMIVVGDVLEIRINGEWTSYIALCLMLIAHTYWIEHAGRSLTIDASPH